MSENNAGRYIRRLDDYVAQFEASLETAPDPDFARLLESFRAFRAYLVRDDDIDHWRFSAVMTFVADMCAESADLREHLLGNMKERMEELAGRPTTPAKPRRAFTLVKH